MSMCSEDEKEVTPRELLDYYKHPNLYINIKKKYFVFSLLKIGIKLRSYFSFKKVTNHREFKEMLNTIHVWLSENGIEMTCGCEERKKREREEYQEFLDFTVEFFEDRRVRLLYADLHKKKSDIKK